MDVSDVCSICKKQSDEMLMLVCVHDPCLDCAASSFAEQVHVKFKNPSRYICNICGEETSLDNTSVEELNNLAKIYARIPTNIKISNDKKKRTKGRSTHKSSSKPQKKSITPKLQKNVKKGTVYYYCKEHVEEEISYYCFACQETICPQCAIHGSHRDHNVKLMKKSIGEVKQKYSKVMENISLSQNAVNTRKQVFIRQIKLVSDGYKRDRNFLARQFDILKSSLENKEKQMEKSLEQSNKENIHILSTFLENINVFYEDLSKIHQTVEAILRKDEPLIFQEFKNISQLSDKVEHVKMETANMTTQLSVLHSQTMNSDFQELNEHILKLRESFRKMPINSTDQTSRVKDNVTISSKMKENEE